MFKFKWERLCYVAALAIISFGLVGCGTQEPMVIYKDRLIFPDDNLLVDCAIDAPPAKEDYLKKLETPLKTAERREELSTKYGKAQTDNLVQCNVRLKNIRQQKADLTIKLAPKPSPSAKE